MVTRPSSSRRLTPQQRRVAWASSVGTAVEWYDYFIYANAAALVFAPIFFAPLEGQWATIVSFSTVGVSFFFRPLGAVIMGRIGDRLGRRAVLVATLLIMGAATTAIGLLPTYAMIGIWAPILLIVLRILQGFSAGGEWGGAALIAVEHAPRDRRGKLGAFPQMGVAAGMLLAAGVNALIAVLMSEEQFASWGWRVPFLLSFVLILIGHYIRRRVDESPVFTQMQTSNRAPKAPLTTLFRRHPKLVAQASLVFLGNNAAGYMLAGGFILNFTTKDLGMDHGAVLNLITVASLAWLATTWWSAFLSDYIGRRRMYIIGWVAMLAWIFPFFMLIGTGEMEWVAVALIGFGAVLGLSTGQMPAFYAELFPSHVRQTGSSISHALGSILGGAFAPTIAVALVMQYNTVLAVAVYLFLVVAISLVATLTVPDRTGASLYPEEEGDELQAPAKNSADV